MYAGRDFSPFESIESDNLTFDFSKHPHIADGEVIEEATWYCEVAEDSETTDDDAADHVSIPATFDSTSTTQHVSGLVDGVKYTMRAVIGTDQGNTLSLWAFIVCRDPH